MTAPLVSCIIPVFNAEPWLEETITSVKAQTHRPIEVIVVDDGSTDQSVTIARRFESPEVRVVTQPNRGASAARNHGLRLAGGEYVQFLDADDLLAPDKIARQLAALRAVPPGCVAAGAWGRFHSSPASAVFGPEENWRDSDPVEWLVLNFAGRGMMPPAAWLVPRSTVQRVGPWDERLSLNDDGEYFCRILLASAGIKFCADARAYYRSDIPGSLSRRRSEAGWRSALLSQELCATHLLGHENSARTRAACADLFQRLAFSIWPDCPEIVARCEALVAQYGGSKQRAGGGRIFRLVSRLFGWKVARGIQARRQKRLAG